MEVQAKFLNEIWLEKIGQRREVNGEDCHLLRKECESLKNDVMIIFL